MAIIENSNTPVLFIGYQAREGQLYRSEKGADGKYVRKALRGLDNIHLTKVAIVDDEYDNKPTKKLSLSGLMDKGTAQETRIFFEANIAAGAVVAFAMGLAKMDAGKPFGIIPKTQKAGSTYKMADGKQSEPLKNDFHSLLVLQDETYVRGEKAPKGDEIKNPKTGEVVARDYSERDAVVAAAIAGISVNRGAGNNASHEPSEPHPDADYAVDPDQIPF